jgi:hypothetical protein
MSGLPQQDGVAGEQGEHAHADKQVHKISQGILQSDQCEAIVLPSIRAPSVSDLRRIKES